MMMHLCVVKRLQYRGTIWGMIFGLFFSCAPVAGGQIIVRLKSEATVSAPEILLRDVARVSSSTATENEKAAAVEIGSLQDLGDTIEITAKRIQIELALAGYPYESIQVLGARSVRVQYEDPIELTDADVEAAAQSTMENLWDVASEDVQVKLVAPLISTLPPNIRSIDGLRAEVTAPTRATLGQLSLSIGLWNDRTLVASRTVRFDVLRRYDVVVARRALKRGHQIIDADIVSESRFLAKESDQSEKSAYHGMVLKQSVKAGDLLSFDQVDSQTSANGPLAIKARDNVRVIAARGAVRITLNSGEAMQPGRVGDVIKVKNTDSGEILTGRITQAGYIEAQF